ncbi:alpha/beta hydrolase-fold protein [Acinetobacter vivianii]|uniref:Alpha/beta hydrolase-fold protein n=1 Tax=Acinetobacter vivianii TaxID=1776742 RepID=A0AAJ6NFY9_9GAMM|nr:alpha/beta hydrolase-fold protein [Acinetobacter vivianii]WDZ49665.1 alpha/beta hydrolase-fold protein [Acinetobacter vivianii]
MLKRLGILTFSLMIATQSVIAQPSTASSSSVREVQANTQTRQSFILKSKYTAQEYLIQISTPDRTAPVEGFPVLYVLDGNAAFESAANIAKSVGAGANRLGLSPVVIVAVGYPDQNTFDVQKRALDYTPKTSAEFQAQAKYQYGGADQFIQFLDKELKPAISSRIKVNAQQQSLFGHSFGGLFALHTFFTKPQTFQRYIAASPSLWFDNYVLLNRQAEWLKNQAHTTQNVMLMTTVGTQELGKGPAADADALKKQNDFYQNFKDQHSKQFSFWHFQHPAEQHLTNMYASLPKAILLAGCQTERCAVLFDEPKP